MDGNHDGLEVQMEPRAVPVGLWTAGDSDSVAPIATASFLPSILVRGAALKDLLLIVRSPSH